ncbi:MAG: alpha,alpha-trehalase [Spirochaetaceae bacterium]|nr:MAG: alpha,alpha-trehalase [Spirochaetaceae bacterium]
MTTNTARGSHSDVLAYIRANWDRSVQHDHDGSGFDGIDLPYPYTTPCVKGDGRFSFFFYWDTYFTNLGLLRQERYDLAESNIRNMMWLIERDGFMPNHVGLDNRSQVPYFGLMAADYVDATGDENLLEAVCDYVRQEYFFWFHARATTTGLTRCGQRAPSEDLAHFYDTTIVRRLGLSESVPIAEKVRIAAHRLAECETGWDFTERFDARALEFAAVEMNANLYRYECFLSEASEKLGTGDPGLWRQRADDRHARIDRYLWNNDRGLYLDYDCAKERSSDVAALVTFQPLYTGLASADQAAAVARSLPLFEREFGIAVTEQTPNCRSYQWGYPNMWPPMVWIAAAGLMRYGFIDDALRIARIYVDVCDRLFDRTGQLWEKIDVETGEIAGGEYEAQPMLGWSAGVYVALRAILDERDA